MFSYAGVTLPLPPPDVLAWARRRISYESLRLWDEPWGGAPARPLQSLPVRAWDPWPVRDPQSLPARPWLSEGPLRLNTLLWPSGASRWGVFHALVDDAAMDKIRGATGSFGQPLTLSDGGPGPALSVAMYPLPPRPLSQIPGANGLQLLTLLDRRAYWPWLAADVDVVGGVTSWADLFGAIAAALGITLAVNDVPAAYLSPPAALSGAYDSLPALLDAACLSCGLRFAAALDGTSYRCWSVAAAREQVARNLSASNPRVAGGVFLQGADLNGILPAAVRVVFPRADDGLPDPAPVVVPVTLASLNIPSNPPGGPAPGGIGGLTRTFHSSAVATYSGGSPTNSGALAALATQAATDFYTWQATGVYDLAFAGVAPWLPTGADGLCEYAHDPDRGAGGGILSRFRRDSYFDGQESLWHHTVTPCAAIPTRARVVGTTLTDGCLFAAELVVRSGCADAPVSPAVAVWLRIDGPDLVGPPAWTPEAGDTYEAGPEGVRGADGLPVYVTRGPFGRSGPAHSFGLVPDPGGTAGTSRYLREDATWHTPPTGTGGGGAVGPGDTFEVESGGTLLLDSGAILVFAGPTWNVTANTTATISAGVALAFVGGNVSTSVVSLSSLTWQYASTSVVVFAGPAVQVTANTTLTVSASTSLTFVGVSSSTSVIGITSLTWSYANTSVLVFAGPTWNITNSTTTTITGGQTWLVTGGTVQYSNTAIDVHTGTAVNLTDDSTWTITSLKVWNVTGGSLSWTNITLVFGAGAVVNLTANQTWTLSGGVALTVTGGTLNLNSAVVFGGPSFTFGLATNNILLCGDLVFDVCPTPLVPAPVVQFNRPLRPNAGIQVKGPGPVPVVIDPGVEWAWSSDPTTPGTVSLMDMILGMGTGLQWGITDDVTTTIAPGKTWGVVGGPGSKFDLTGVTTEVAPAGGTREVVTDVACVAGVISVTKESLTFLSTGLTGPLNAVMARSFG